MTEEKMGLELAREKGFTEEQYNMLQQRYRACCRNGSYEALKKLWDKVDVPPEESIFEEEVFSACKTLEDLFRWDDIISRYTIGKIRAPQHIFEKFAKKCLEVPEEEYIYKVDGSNKADRYNRLLNRMPDRSRVEAMVQEAYKYFLKCRNLTHFKTLIQYRKIPPDPEMVRAAFIEYWQDGVPERADTLKFILERNLPENGYNFELNLEEIL